MPEPKELGGEGERVPAPSETTAATLGHALRPTPDLLDLIDDPKALTPQRALASSGPVTMLVFGGEGGEITLRGVLDEAGCWWFRLAPNARTLAGPEACSEEGWITCWEEVLRKLDRYPWALLVPRVVHPDLSDVVLAAVQTRLADEDGRRRASSWARWKRLCADVSTAMPRPPRAFDGSLAELFTGHVEAILPAPGVVEAFHGILAAYCEGADPLFVIRARTTVESRDPVRSPAGRWRPSDRSPAHWLHHRLFHRLRVGNVARLEELLTHVPCHKGEIWRSPFQTINRVGWQAASILKDDGVDGADCSREDLKRAFVRNLHPCNSFFLPTASCGRYQHKPDVRGFFAEVYRDRYGRVWQEFLQMAGDADLPAPELPPESVHYSYSPRVTVERKSPDTAEAPYVVLMQTTGTGQVPIGRVLLRDGRIVYEGVDPVFIAGMERGVRVGRRIYTPADGDAFLRVLPVMYSGAYVRAKYYGRKRRAASTKVPPES